MVCTPIIGQADVRVQQPFLISKEYRAHWRLLREHLGPRSHHKSRAVKTLALLVESGAIYCILLVSTIYCAQALCPDGWDGCALWQIIMVVYKATPALFAAPDVHQNAFFQVVAYYTYACFTYVIVSIPSALPAVSR